MISTRFKNDSQPLLKLNNIQLAAKKEVEMKIQNGKYTFENISCPVCNSIKTELLSEKDRYGLDFHVVVCLGCGLIYTNPRMTQKSYNEFYDQEYRKLYNGDESPTELFFKDQYNTGKRIYAFINDALPGMDFKGRNILEIGCGAGGILLYFKEQRCNVKGYDLGNEYLQFGKNNYGLDLTCGSLKNVPEEYKPDIVIFSHVLEHLVDFNSELHKLKEICTPETLLYIEVPGVKDIHDQYRMDSLLYFQNAHTFHFTLSSLTNLFVKNGFKLIIGTEYVKSIFSLDSNPINNKEIKNEYPEIVNYLKNIEKKRFLYLFKISTINNRIKSLIVCALRRVKLLEPLQKLKERYL